MPNNENENVSTVNETIVTGKKYRVLKDKINGLWNRISFWTSANDVEFTDSGSLQGMRLNEVVTSIQNSAGVPGDSVVILDNNDAVPEGWELTTKPQDIVDLENAVDELNDNLSWYVANGWLPAIPSGDVPANMEDCSWAMLKSLASAGTLGNYYQIGDTKTIELVGGERVVMELVSINDGSGSAGGYYPRGTVDFISKDCLQTKYQMNDTSQNIGWGSTYLRNTLNTVIYASLPQLVKDAIVAKTHKTASAPQSTTLVENTDNLWLPTEWELYGTITNSATTENADVNIHYPTFTNDNSRIKHLGTNGSACRYWLSSPRGAYANVFCATDPAGTAAAYPITDTNTAVPLCFRIGQLYT